MKGGTKKKRTDSPFLSAREGENERFSQSRRGRGRVKLLRGGERTILFSAMAKRGGKGHIQRHYNRRQRQGKKRYFVGGNFSLSPPFGHRRGGKRSRHQNRNGG